ncbi:MAG: HAMP domain-containing histidine kinase [Bacteroidales bacterium]|nr:HAMP domain-containing histidine kinase [Bacteroidales bacterium]
MKKPYIITIILLVAVAAALFAASFIKSDPIRNVQSEAKSAERHLIAREHILDRYSSAVLSGEVQLHDEAGLPEDMVIYHYKHDSLHCWINQFPVYNDAIVTDQSEYSMHHLYRAGESSTTPLAYIDDDESYVNLGSAWYFIKNYRQDSQRLLAAIFIKSDYSHESLKGESQVNPRLRLDSKYTTEPLMTDSGAVVHSASGKPLFSIAEKSSSRFNYGYYPLHWIVILLLIAAAFVLHLGLKNKYSFAVYIVSITLLALWARYLAHICDPSSPIFSPLTYAGSNILDSLASLLTINCYIFLVAIGLSLLRVHLIKLYRRMNRPQRIATAVACVALTVALALYINYALRSVVYNSNLTFNLANINRINIYPILCLVSFGLLFTALLHCIQMSISAILGRRRLNIFSWKYLLPYIAIVAFYTVLTIYSTSLKKEFYSNKVWTDRLSVDRDLSLEMQLRMIEPGIKSDQIIALLSFWPNGGSDIIRNRIMERYLSRSFSTRYNLTVTTCNSETQMIIDRNTPAVNCIGYYSDELRKYGSPLSTGSSFFFMNNFNGQTSYLGVFTYINYDTLQTTNLYIEITSRFSSDNGTNMSGILFKNSSELSLPAYYSYAKYYAGRLVTYSGHHAFPTNIDTEGVKFGYYMQRKGDTIFFINKVSDDDIVIISRPVPGFLRHLVLFSYLLLLFGLIIIPLTARLRRSKLLSMPRNSYKRRITSLVLFTTLLALGCVGVGTILFVAKRNKNVNERNMVRNMEIVQSTLSEYCQYALRYTDINTPQLQEAMKSISASTANEINVYDSHGVMVCTTQPELYNQSILGSRMNYAAYRAIVEESYMNYIGQESIAGNTFQSIYAPLFNIDGMMVAIANIPYVTGQSQFQEEGTMIIASIVNLYLLILIISIVISLMLANSISRPLTEIKNKMERLSGGTKMEHLEYKEGKDEIGMLVTTYNRMVDELDESTRRLARTERDSAWKEMARQIAHEIKNPLTPMQLSIQHVQRLKRDNAPGWQEEFDKVSRSLLEQIDILSRTASNFSALSKLFSDEVVSREDLVPILRQELVLFDAHENISVELSTELESAPVNIRKQQIIRAFLNLLSNAVQALGKDGGKVMISLTSTGSNYRVSVEDDGPGVSEGDVGKLFSSNFTTKTTGSGLGLAICKDIFEQNGGTISYERSQKLGGASFVITLPAA